MHQIAINKKRFCKIPTVYVQRQIASANRITTLNGLRLPFDKKKAHSFSSAIVLPLPRSIHLCISLHQDQKNENKLINYCISRHTFKCKHKHMSVLMMLLLPPPPPPLLPLLLLRPHTHSLAQSISICTGNIEFMVLLNDH